jgi:alpha-2-macroglobulin
MIHNSTPFKKVCLILAIMLSIGAAYGQNLIGSRQTSYETFIYRLTDKEARQIHRKNLWVVDETFFHTLVDKFPTDSIYSGKLPQGHYLKTYSEKGKQKFSVLSVPAFDAFILNNNTDLSVQVFDLNGKSIPDAKVKLRTKRLRFDAKSQSYLDRKSNRKGLLTIEHEGATGYYQIDRSYNNSWFKRSRHNVVYRTPLKYVWLPVNYVVHLPVDGVKSISQGHPRGTIYRTKEFFVRSYNRIVCLFDSYHCDYYGHRISNDQFKGYMVFNKPKYFPGDTVRFKAFVVDDKGRPVKKDVTVRLRSPRKTFNLAKLSPYRTGAFEFSFFLHDSLELQLDRSYNITLEVNDKKDYISSSFRYEDYELTKISLNLSMKEAVQYKGKPFKIVVRGIDENDLNLPDGRLEVLVVPKKVDKYFESRVFIPDTLFYFESRLEPSGETELSIPDSLFPQANFEYEVAVRLLTSDNETISERKSVQYFHERKGFEMDLVAGTATFTYEDNGEETEVPVVITASDRFGIETEIIRSITPVNVDINPYYSQYRATTGSVSDAFDIASQPSLLQCFSQRTSDSIFIMVDNPRNLLFNYNIYKRNSEKLRGHTDSLNISKSANNGQNYFVSIRYLWGGEVKEDTYRIPLNDKALNIEVLQPALVYPGQQTRIELVVSDVDGKPVPDVDVTAFGLTKKFGYSPPSLPYLGKVKKNKTVVNNFKVQDVKFKAHPGYNLNYEEWKLLAGVDSIEYYKFLYPGNEVYRNEYKPEGNITQFAPFVVSKGAVEPVHVVYVDNRPVYFSWTTTLNPYSFRIAPGYRQIKLRTREHEIVIDSLFISRDVKMVFSVDVETVHKLVKVRELKPELTTQEKGLLYRYIFPYRQDFGNKYAFVESGDDLKFLMAAGQPFRGRQLAGPVSGNVTFSLLDEYSMKFHHEPFFEYDFSPSILKMRQFNIKQVYPDKLNYTSETGLSDEVWTKNRITERWEEFLDNTRRWSTRYWYPASTNPGAGKLLIDFDNAEEKGNDSPLNVLLFRHDQYEFLRVYQGNVRLLHELDTGKYQLVLFYPGAKYLMVDSIDVKVNGLNYCRVELTEQLKKDSFSIVVGKLIEKTLFTSRPRLKVEEDELRQIYSAYQEQLIYSVSGELVDGFVYDEDGEPLRGVTVLVKGTNIGTVTNLNGFYSLKVPFGHEDLLFQFIGYETVEAKTGSSPRMNVAMEPVNMALDEVVVIGYGTKRSGSITGSVTTVSSGMPGLDANISQALQGRIAGVQITENDGVSIRIRGSNPVTFDSKPLYIVDGLVYTGNIGDLDPSLIRNIEMLKDEQATAVYGSMGANGVVIISTVGEVFKSPSLALQKGADYDDAFLEAVSQAGSIRENFSDYAFWQPRLKTNEDGRAAFDVTFPDDVTNWETFFLAMNDKRQTGQAQAAVKSYKPLMAQLAVPRFLVQSDTSFVIGKTMNYTPDSVKVSRSFSINGDELFSDARYCKDVLLDTLMVVANKDSLSIQYKLEKEDGYFDGEIRDIPVFPIGLEEAAGYFYVLGKDTTLTLSFDEQLGPVTLYARSDVLDVFEREIRFLVNYRFDCNEQLASRLKALLARKQIAAFKGEAFKDDRHIEKMIRLLINNQKPDGLWGWWKTSVTSDWISLHVLEALMAAKNAGYNVSLNEDLIAGRLIWMLENERDFMLRVNALKVFKVLGSSVNAEVYINDLERYPEKSLNRMLHLIELKQMYGMESEIDTLNSFRHTTIFGNVYYSDRKQSRSLTNNDIQNTILAYRIFKRDSLKCDELLEKIRFYFFENRRSGYWRNTYESAQIIEIILPDMLGERTSLEKPTLHFSGEVDKTVTEFPFEMQLDASSIVSLTKTGDFPVYLTGYQRYWNQNPVAKSGDFVITTHFDSGTANELKAGKEVKLIVNVSVKKDSEYMMISIPIPGGCSYGEKTGSGRFEVHREYFRNEAVIFCQRLREGDYTFEINLMPRYTGKYTLNPAKVELMYFPLFNANNEVEKVEIK